MKGAWLKHRGRASKTNSADINDTSHKTLPSTVVRPRSHRPSFGPTQHVQSETGQSGLTRKWRADEPLKI